MPYRTSAYPGCAETIEAPAAHAGIVDALRAAFRQPPALPDELDRLLEQLR